MSDVDQIADYLDHGRLDDCNCVNLAALRPADTA
jgi:hypothetical protein